MKLKNIRLAYPLFLFYPAVHHPGANPEILELLRGIAFQNVEPGILIHFIFFKERGRAGGNNGFDNQSYLIPEPFLPRRKRRSIIVRGVPEDQRRGRRDVILLKPFFEARRQIPFVITTEFPDSRGHGLFTLEG